MDSSTLAATPATGWQATLNNLIDAGRAYLTLEQQRELAKINLERARQGLAPLSTTDYGLGVQVGIDSETKKLVYTAAIFAVVGIVVNRLLK